MSTFGLMVMFVFIIATGGLVALIYSGNTEMSLSKILMLVLQVLVGAELVLALYEYPCYAVDAIIYVCMGEPKLAWIMLAILALIILFIMAMILPRLNWSKSLTVKPGKLIVTGLLLMVLLAYTELINGVYSFESYDQFIETRQLYEEYDDRFFPTKYIRHTTDDEEERIALYPFDVTTAAGELPVLYKAETFSVTHEDGTTELFYYPFTYRLYEGAEPVSFFDRTVPQTSGSDAADDGAQNSGTSGGDVSGGDASGSDTGAAQEQPAE